MLTIGYLGPDLFHKKSTRIGLEAHGYKTLDLRDSFEWTRTKNKSVSVLERFNGQIRGVVDEAYLDSLIREIDSHGVEWLIAYWGLRPLPAIRALSRRRPHLKIVLNLLCHPLALEPIKVRAQHWILGRAMSSLSGIICTSHVMCRYLTEHIPTSRGLPMFIKRPATTIDFAPTKPLGPLADEANCLFLGRTDFRGAQRSDDVTNQLHRLMEEKILVYFAQSSDGGIEHQYARGFKPVAVESVADFASNFDASLITYNLDSVSALDRFSVTIPDRMITSVCAGLPVAFPSDGYEACEEYVADYGAVIRYSSEQELAAILKDRKHIESLRRIGREHCGNYREEPQIPALIEFFKGL